MFLLQGVDFCFTLEALLSLTPLITAYFLEIHGIIIKVVVASQMYPQYQAVAQGINDATP